LLTLAFLILGIANPQIGSKLEEVKRRGVDVMIVIDVSNSMLAEDIKPNRLSRAKQLVSRLIDKLENDRIGIVVFAGDVFLQLPMTSDYSAAKLLLSTIDTDIIPGQGTAIGKAIEMAMNSFPSQENKYKTIIIITDGENHEDDAIAAANEAVKNGIIIHTIGMGSVQGGPIPIYKKNTQVDFIRGNDGEIVISKLDATALQQIAAAGNGKFIRSSGTDPELSDLIVEIAKMEKKEYGSKLFTDYEDRFQYFIGAAVFLLILELFISDRKNKLLDVLNFFGGNKQ
jgi:Ca-activated chloride channel family protein